MPTNGRRKGVAGELEWAEVLRAEGFEARRGQQYAGSADSPDVVTELDDGFHFEVKRTECLRLYDALEQAQRDGGEKVCCVAHRRNRGDWMVIMSRADFFALLRGALGRE